MHNFGRSVHSCPQRLRCAIDTLDLANPSPTCMAKEPRGLWGYVCGVHGRMRKIPDFSDPFRHAAFNRSHHARRAFSPLVMGKGLRRVGSPTKSSPRTQETESPAVEASTELAKDSRQSVVQDIVQNSTHQESLNQIWKRLAKSTDMPLRVCHGAHTANELAAALGRPRSARYGAAG